MLHSLRRKALVLGHDTRAFLSVVRSLGRAGIEVHVAWFDPDGPAARSRYIARAHGLPLYRPDADDWKLALLDLIGRESFDLVIPCDDQSALPLAAHRAEFEAGARLALPGERALEIFGDKRKTTELARSLCIPVPREEVVSDMGEAPALRERFSPPLIVKPPASYSLHDVKHKQMVRRARSWDEFDRVLADTLEEGPAVVQEFHRGQGVGVELLLQRGEPLLALQHVRLHEPLGGGGSTYRESVPVSQDLLDAATELMRAVDYTGVAMVEFKQDSETGRWVLIEVNARFWGSLPLAVAAGADFPLALFQLLVEGRTDVPSSYRTGLRARNLRHDLKWHYTNLRADRTDPAIESRPWPGVAAETLGSLATLRERSDSFTLDDPRPGVAEVAQLAREGATELRALAMLAHARASRRRRERLREAACSDLRGKQRILFVCKGNIVRSPFAAALAQRWLGDGQDVLSAGFLPAGRTTPSAAVAAAARWDVDLASHRSDALTEELVGRSDAIFVFDHQNYSGMVSRFPGARDRVHLVGSLSGGEPLLIPDPLPRGNGAFAPAYERIAAALEAALAPR
jgi:predicted ATP-grasp superfamily ATP-dependent carboligase/protein-tyrosine-phosphatase